MQRFEGWMESSYGPESDANSWRRISRMRNKETEVDRYVPSGGVRFSHSTNVIEL